MLRLTLKMALISALSTLLLLPTAYICSLTKERKERRDDITRSAGNLWGNHHEIGAVLETGKQTALPVSAEINGTVSAETRNRGIFQVPFYSADLEMKLTFNLPQALPASNLTLFGMRISETDFARSEIDGKEIRFRESDSARQIRAGVPALEAGSHTATLRFRLLGTQRLHFFPSAKALKIHLQSNWPHPNFSGSLLPASRTIDKTGFTAEWSVKPQNPESFLQEMKNAEDKENMEEGEEATSFGVDFFVPVDIYAQIERASKYGMLFIALTFLTFFIFEVVASLQIHPVQYLFVGLALSLFFLLLLSLAEHIGFGPAYALASLADIGLITAYSLKVLQSRRRAGILLGILLSLYVFLYVILQLAMYSLLAGSIGLFMILAAVMYVTRNIDWYARDTRPA